MMDNNLFLNITRILKEYIISMSIMINYVNRLKELQEDRCRF